MKTYVNESTNEPARSIETFEQTVNTLEPKGELDEFNAPIPPEAKPASSTPPGSQPKPEDTIPEAKSFFNLVLENSRFFHTPDGVAYASVNVKGHHEVWPINSQEFELIVVRWFYEENESFPFKKELKKLLQTLTWLAKIEGPQRDVFIRYARISEAIYIDLANPHWEQIKITKSGYEVISCAKSPAHFIRTPALLPIPKPKAGETIEKIRPFLNVKSDEDFMLIAAWMLSAMYPDGPFPILILHGSHGSAKSTTTRMICECLDPNKAVLRTLPNSERNMLIAASNSYVQSFDNVSALSTKQSDGFCRLSTGSGFRRRKLYTDNLEIILNPKRPTFFNGISYFAIQNDLLDRSIVINLPSIPAENRKPESVIKQEWESEKPFIIGALCDALSTALRNIDNVTVPNSPRMSDFVRLLTAAEPSLPWKNGSFIKAYDANLAESVNYALEADPIGEIILKIVRKHGEWSGTFSDLLEMMENAASKNLKQQKEWPKGANILSNRLMRLEGFLRSKGMEITREPRKTDKRIVRLKMAFQSAPPAINAEVKTQNMDHSDSGVGDSDSSLVLKEIDDFEDINHAPSGKPAIVEECFEDCEQVFEEGVI